MIHVAPRDQVAPASHIYIISRSLWQRRGAGRNLSASSQHLQQVIAIENGNKKMKA
jgi:hypothetical protein